MNLNKVWDWKAQLSISELAFSLSYQFLWTGQLLKELAVSHLRGFLIYCSLHICIPLVLPARFFLLHTFQQLTPPPILTSKYMLFSLGQQSQVPIGTLYHKLLEVEVSYTELLICLSGDLFFLCSLCRLIIPGLAQVKT